MQTMTPTSSIISIGNAAMHEAVLNNWHQYDYHNNFRGIKKLFRHDKPALIIACIGDENDEQLSKQVTQYVRDGLANQDTRIVLMHEPSFELDEISWMQDFQINGCLLVEDKRHALNLNTLSRELDTFSYIDNNRRQHDAETDMLMCITQFSKAKEPISELLKVFSKTLSTLCYSACSFHISIKNNTQGLISYCDNEKGNSIGHLNNILGLPTIPDYLQNTINEKHPQIDLLPEKVELNGIEKISSQKIGSYLTFPISAYDKVLYLLVYLIPESQMAKISMKQINVINKASEQLTILLERRQAESSLKKQYKRLKDALVDLKITKQELNQKEKMASIGQMAAGIAHEINNPLSYVISNFSSIDHYLTSIMQLQELQSEFLCSIDIGQNQKIQELKNNISKFEEDEDINFILDDVRAVVADSHNGLKRVKNIITDLKSFTYSQSTELEACDLDKVIDETLKLLSYDIGDTISIEKKISALPHFMAHDGLMQQVLTNLIKNAAQALQEAKTEKPRITVTAENIDATIQLKIRDNGPGISKDARVKIFEPFYTTKTVGEGTGLGLSVTFNIIKKLGGTIDLESEENVFTEFLITFPVSKN